MIRNKGAANDKLQFYLDYLNQLAPNKTSIIAQGCAAMLIYFALLGLSWVIPFPYLKFLGRYNSFFNWSSFVIAFSIYYYSTLSPLLSYVMLFLTLIFTYLISLITSNQHDNIIWIAVFTTIILLAEAMRLISIKNAGKHSTVKMEFLSVLIGPIWSIHFMLENRKIKY